MKFAPRELCEKLVEMGCKSESGLAWNNTNHVGIAPHDSFAGFALSQDLAPFVPAFTLEDFCGTSDQARENAKIIWGNKYLWLSDYYCPEGLRPEPGGFDWKTNWQMQRHAMIDSPDWVKYLEETMVKK